jgi:hypothetical protein
LEVVTCEKIWWCKEDAGNFNPQENLAPLYHGSVHRAPVLQQTTCKNIVIIKNLCTQNTALVEMRNTETSGFERAYEKPMQV